MAGDLRYGLVTAMAKIKEVDTPVKVCGTRDLWEIPTIRTISASLETRAKKLKAKKLEAKKLEAKKVKTEKTKREKPRPIEDP